MNKLTPSYLSEMVLYTISNPTTSEAFKNLLNGYGFIKEGDQSTMMHRCGGSHFNPEKFYDLIVELNKKYEFKDKETISLIQPGYHKTGSIMSKTFKLGDLKPFIKRYHFRFDSSSSSFTYSFNKKRSDPKCHDSTKVIQIYCQLLPNTIG